MGLHDKLILSWAVGSGDHLAAAKNRKDSWPVLRKLLSSPTRTKEKHKTYLKMSRDDQLHLKSINGWISGAQCTDSRRSLRTVLPRDVATFDLDHPAVGFYSVVQAGMHWINDYEFLVLSTRSSTDESPRYRIVMPMARMVSPEEWNPLARIISLRIEGGTTPMKQVDKVSSRRAQMMFLPTVSADQEFEFHHNEGAILDPDEHFAWYEITHGDWRDLSNLPLYEGEDTLRAHADKAEDPLLKQGPIGDWCRAYTISEVIAEHLPDKYIPGDTTSGKPRYTYVGGSASNGAVVEDDDRFLYSHHGTDPCAEQLVNAYDLVRIHMFGMLDENVKDGLSITDYPSTKAMREFMATDPKFIKARAAQKYDMAAMFEDSDVGDEEFEEDLSAGEKAEYTAPPEDEDADEFDFTDDDLGPDMDGPAQTEDVRKKKRTDKNPNAKTWFETLDFDKNGSVIASAPNVSKILANDPRFYNKIRYDLFANVTRLFGDIKSKTESIPDLICKDKVRGDRWQEIGRATIRAILATGNGPGKIGYGLTSVSERDITDGVLICATINAYHPVKDYVASVEWDGVKRVESLFVNYLGIDDNAYARETAKLVMLASISRIFEPGHKFDYAPVIQGSQGIRKSSFIEALYTVNWFGEINVKLDETQKIAETIGGKWGMEFPELAAFRRTDHNDAKQFMSAREDTVRMAYAHEVSVIPRQTVFWGTTNDDTYLKDRTGNRRWWPLIVGVAFIDTAALMANLSQIWAEALAMYRDMRVQYPKDGAYDLPLVLTTEARLQAEALQEEAREHGMAEDWAEKIANWLDAPMPLRAFLQMAESGWDYASAVGEDADPDTTYVRLTAFTSDDALTHALGFDGAVRNNMHIVTVLQSIRGLSAWGKDKPGNKKGQSKRWGRQRQTWWVRTDASEEDAARGFVVVPAPEFHEPGFVDDYGLTEEDLEVSIDDLV